MATSPIYSWPEPDNTDLVKNGALAIRTLGNAIDTTMATMTPKSAFTAKGSIAAATAASTPANVTVGANDTLLAADSTAAAGVAWKTSTTLYPWTAYSPTYTNLTIGNGTVTARYQQIGKLIHVYWKLVWGSTTSLTAYPLISFPATANQGDFVTGTSQLTDASAGIAVIGAVYQELGKASFQPSYTTSNTTYTTLGFITGNTLPFTWTTSDVMVCSFAYEVA